MRRRDFLRALCISSAATSVSPADAKKLLAGEPVKETLKGVGECSMTFGKIKKIYIVPSKKY